jgi:hypothetical protein
VRVCEGAHGDIGCGPRMTGRVLGLIVEEGARCYPKRANNFGTSDLAGKAQDVECEGPLRDGNRGAGSSYMEKRRGGGTIRAVEWGRKEFGSSLGA